MKPNTAIPKNSGHHLRDAASTGNLTELKRLVGEGISANDRDPFNNTALLHASRHGKIDCVHFLIDSGADVNAANDSGYTPLICAAIIGDCEIVKVLLDAKAEVWHSLKNEDGSSSIPPRTALALAEYRRHYKVAELLKSVEVMQPA